MGEELAAMGLRANAVAAELPMLKAFDTVAGSRGALGSRTTLSQCKVEFVMQKRSSDHKMCCHTGVET